jgi:hypothetical protein
MKISSPIAKFAISIGFYPGTGRRPLASLPRETLYMQSMTDNVDAERNTILSSLTQVGPTKPVGYLPLYTICDVLQMDPYALAQDARVNGRSVAIFGADQCCIKSGALYVFDGQSLERLLRSSKLILSANRWPIDPHQFVARIAREWIDDTHAVAPVIERAFGQQST